MITKMVVWFWVVVLTFASVGTYAQTPSAEGQRANPEVSEAPGTRQLLWNDDAEALPTIEGGGDFWVPASLRYVEVPDDFYTFTELRNDSDEDALAPVLVFELFIEGQSYGTEEVYPDNYWVPAGQSAFYHSLHFYGMSLALEDWDEEVLSVRGSTSYTVDEVDTSSVRVEGDRLFNDGELPLGEVYFQSIIRDSDGIYTASCSGPYTGATTPPGRSVKLSDPLDEEYVPECGFTRVGQQSSESLGIGAPYTTEYVISSIRD